MEEHSDSQHAYEEPRRTQNCRDKTQFQFKPISNHLWPSKSHVEIENPHVALRHDAAGRCYMPDKKATLSVNEQSHVNNEGHHSQIHLWVGDRSRDVNCRENRALNLTRGQREEFQGQGSRWSEVPLLPLRSTVLRVLSSTVHYPDRANPHSNIQGNPN